MVSTVDRPIESVVWFPKATASCPMPALYSQTCQTPLLTGKACVLGHDKLSNASFAVLTTMQTTWPCLGVLAVYAGTSRMQCDPRGLGKVDTMRVLAGIDNLLRHLSGGQLLQPGAAVCERPHQRGAHPGSSSASDGLLLHVLPPAAGTQHQARAVTKNSS